jgi:hypothetical protein
MLFNLLFKPETEPLREIVVSLEPLKEIVVMSYTQ